VNARGLIAAAAVALCVAGAGTVTQGIAVPVKAKMAQRELGRVFEQRLAANLDSASPVVPKVQLMLPVKAQHRRVAATPQSVKAALPSHGPVARLTVERLGVAEIVLASDGSHEQLALGPTMLKHGDAANPVTVLAAHRDTHFLFIRDLQAGDEVVMQLVTGETARYRITHFETVRWDSFAYPLDPAKPLLALTTCYPFGGTEYGGPLRRVAWAEMVTEG
jgi:sortase A